MNADKLNRWLTLAANLGVLAGLLLLVVEVREAINLSEANAYRNRGTEIQQAMQELALSADLADILAKARDGRIDALNESERVRLWAWEFAKSLRMQNQYNDYAMGFLDDESFHAMIGSAAAAYPLWHALGVSPSDPRFRAAIEAVLAPDALLNTEKVVVAE